MTLLRFIWAFVQLHYYAWKIDHLQAKNSALRRKTQDLEHEIWLKEN